MILFVASKVDIAGINIVKNLLHLLNFRKTYEKFYGNPIYVADLHGSKEAKLVFVNDELVKTQNMQYPNNTEIIIFVSKHSSKSRIPTLSVHTPGNIADAYLGGLPKKVSVSPASAMKAALLEMRKARDENNLPYEVLYECTHHGPSLDIPAMFVELGSSLEQWQDMKAAEAVARGAVAAATNKQSYIAVLGIGGQHYNRKFTEIALTSNLAFGHMIPKYALQNVDEEILRQCIIKTVEPVKKAILDWKGIMSTDKERLLKILEFINLNIEKV